MKPTTNILRRIFHFFLFVASMPLHSIDCKLSNILMIKGERSPFCWHLKKVHLDRCRELLLLLLLGTETIQAEWGRRWICRGHFADRYVFFQSSSQQCIDVFPLCFLQTDEHDDGVQIIPKLEYCRSNHLNIFVGCIYAYKGLLMVSLLLLLRLAQDYVSLFFLSSTETTSCCHLIC